MNHLVRILSDDDGEDKDDANVWHLVDPCNEQGPAALCTQEFFGDGESACTFEEKNVARGGVTCSKCLKIVRTYKAVKL